MKEHTAEAIRESGLQDTEERIRQVILWGRKKKQDLCRKKSGRRSSDPNSMIVMEVFQDYLKESPYVIWSGSQNIDI